LQPPFDDETGRYVKTIFVHGDSGETAECRVPLIIGKNDMQGYGSAATYARRYGLMGMAGIAPDDDDGNAAVIAAPKPEPKHQTPDANAASERAIDYISAAQDIADLQSSWANLPPAVKADARVIAAKDARKAELTATPADLGDGQIPYEGK